MSPPKSYDVLPDAACGVDPSVQPVDQRRPRRRHLDEFVRDEPLTALAIAVTAGFILGGGAETRVGRAALTFVGRFAVRGVVSNLLVGMLTGSHERGAKEFENRG
jgi:hypothetical protein